jgi:hypothetical protein
MIVPWISSTCIPDGTIGLPGVLIIRAGIYIAMTRMGIDLPVKLNAQARVIIMMIKNLQNMHEQSPQLQVPPTGVCTGGRKRMSWSIESGVGPGPYLVVVTGPSKALSGRDHTQADSDTDATTAWCKTASGVADVVESRDG